MKARDLDGALWPLLGVSILFGVWPRRLQASGWVKLLAGAFTIGVTLTELFMLYRIYAWNWKDYSQTEMITVSFFLVMTLLTSSVNIASHVLRKDAAFSAVVTQVALVDSVLGVDRSKVYPATKKWVTVAIAAVFAWYGLSLLLLLNNGELSFALFLVFIDLNIVVTELQFVTLVLTLRHRFCFLNRKLATDSAAAISSVTPLSPAPVASAHHHDDETVRNLQRAHFTLTQLGRRVNRFYGLQNLGNVVLLFLSVTYVIFDLLVVLEDLAASLDASIWFMYVTHLVMPTVKLVAMAVSCQKTETAASSTSLLVSTRQLRCWKERQTTDGALQDLATQVDSMRLKFDAWSLFSIDGPLLRTVVSTIVTYTIILLQFNVAENQNESSEGSCNKTS